MKLRLRSRQEIGKRNIPTLLFRRSIKNLNLSDFNYTKQVDWADQAQRDKISLYGELELKENHARDRQVFVAKKLNERDKRKVMNYLCNMRGISQP